MKNKIYIYILSIFIISCLIGNGSASQVPIPDILQLKFDNETSKGESITLAVDDINDHDGTISNMDDYTIGIYGYAVDLTYPTPASVIISDHNDLSRGMPTGVGDNDFTISFSIKAVDYTDITILTKEDEYNIYMDNSNLIFEQYDSTHLASFTKEFAYDFSKYNELDFVHVVLTGEYPLGISHLYVNNELVAVTDSISSPLYEGMVNTASNLMIGSSSTNHDIVVDELQFYSFYLDERDVDHLYYSYYPGTPDKMYSLWDIIRDITNNIGTIINLIVLSIVLSIVVCVGGFVTSIVKGK